MKKLLVLVIITILAGMNVHADKAINFKDISNHWAAVSINKLAEKKIVNGMPNGNFNPEGELTRAQFVKMIVQAMNYKKIDSVSFNDLKPFPTSKPHWASVFIETAMRNGVIVKDEIGENFYPDVPLTRKDMAMMMLRTLKLQPSKADNPFVDLTEANGSLTRLYEEYLIRGSIISGKRLFNPEALSTRAEAAVIIYRMIDYKADPVKFKDTAAREERFTNGTQTAEDIAAKRKAEIAKAKADSNYIMEPIITVETNGEYKDYRWFELYFENYDDYYDYSDDTKWKLECTNYKQLNNYEMPRPDGTFVEYNINKWVPFGDRGSDVSRPCMHIMSKNYYTTQTLIKDFKLYPGMDIKFKVTVKKGLKERVIYKTVKLQ